MMPPSVCPQWPNDIPGQTAEERNEAARSYTTPWGTILLHVFHGHHERGIGRCRNDKLFFQVRFENVFLASARSCYR